MGLRSCGASHFIQTIRGGLVLKVCNINPHGRPVIRTKTLKDVYESEDATRQQKPHSGLVFDYKQAKHESPYWLVADRTLREIKPENEELAPGADDYWGNGLDGDTTLKQVKRQLLTKKRKCISISENSNQDNANEKAVEDNSDLNELLINLKPKRSKTSKGIRECVNLTVNSSAAFGVSIKSEENLVSEGSSQVAGELAPAIHVKVEVPDAEQLGCQNKTSSVDAPSICLNEVLNPSQKIALHEFDREPLFYVDKYSHCVTNEISYDHLDDAEPISVPFPDDGVSVSLEILQSGSEESLDFPKLETLESGFKESLDSPQVEIERQKEILGSHSCRRSLPEDHSHLRSSCNVEDIHEESSSSGTHVPDMSIVGCMGLCQELNSVQFEAKTDSDFLSDLDDCVSSPGKNFSSKLDSFTTSKTEENLVLMEDTIAEEEQPSAFSFDAIRRNGLIHEGHIEGELLKAVDKQNSAFPLPGEENESSSENKTCHNADTISTPEPPQPPEKLLSTRKALSPSSQERLRLAMNSVEISDVSDQNIASECKGKLVENKAGKKISPLRYDIQCDRITVDHRQPGQVIQGKVIISPRRSIKKPQIAKGNHEGPRFSRTLPNLSTGCTSVQVCSESAIAFSRRQMHDMESLSEKLINELKSMKDIVEQKLLFEAYRNVSLKNDADEVRSAINNAAKVEEMARKWMSMMARDCNRFCKIMKMTPDSISASKDTFPRERRKIVFADEAGGKLCHVKFFNDGVASPVSDAVEQ